MIFSSFSFFLHFLLFLICEYVIMTPLRGTISVSQCKIGLMFLWNQLDIDDTKSSLYGVTAYVSLKNFFYSNSFYKFFIS